MGNDSSALSKQVPAPVLEVTLGPGGLVSAHAHPEPCRHAGVAVAEDSIFTGGKAHGEAVSVEAVRELSESEVAAAPAPNERNSGTTGPAIRALRYQHHEIARLLAAGMKPAEIARTLDVTVPTIARLIATPQFQDLLHGYTVARDKAAVDLGARLKVAGAIAVDKLIEKMEGVPASVMSGDWLTKTALGLADRAGHAPVQRTFNASVVTAISPAEIRAMRMERAAGMVVLAPHSSAPEAKTIENDAGAAEGAGVRGSSLEVSLSDTADALARDDVASRSVVPEP